MKVLSASFRSDTPTKIAIADGAHAYEMIGKNNAISTNTSKEQLHQKLG
jgi:hypothetical protein